MEIQRKYNDILSINGNFIHKAPNSSPVLGPTTQIDIKEYYFLAWDSRDPQQIKKF